MPKTQEAMKKPDGLIIQYLRSESRVSISIANESMRVEGLIVMFDPNKMTVVLFEAEEHCLRTDERKKLGVVLLNVKDNITSIQNINPEPTSLAEKKLEAE